MGRALDLLALPHPEEFAGSIANLQQGVRNYFLTKDGELKKSHLPKLQWLRKRSLSRSDETAISITFIHAVMVEFFLTKRP